MRALTGAEQAEAIANGWVPKRLEQSHVLIRLVGRGTFPLSQTVDARESCPFLFNDLLASDDDADTIATWIRTADAMTYIDPGVFNIHPEMTKDCAPSAEQVLVSNYEQSWYHFPAVGIAAMPMAVLRD